MTANSQGSAKLIHQDQIRKNLLECFQDKMLTPFPQTKPGLHYQSFFPSMELFCSCLMPESYDDMVECNNVLWGMVPLNIKCVGLQKLPSISEHAVTVEVNRILLCPAYW